MATVSSIKIDKELLELARAEASIFQRSIAGQMEHWARLGRAVESGPGFTLDRVRAALTGEFDADNLSEDEARIFMDEFAAYLMGPNAESEALAEKMRQEGGYVGEDEQGRLVRTLPGGGVEVIG